MAFQKLECMVLLGGDSENQTIVHRNEDSPVTYPEMLVLQYLHGDEAVTDVYELPGDPIERDNSEELDRLRVTYGAKAITDVFPGAKPRLPARDNRVKPRVAPTAPKRKPAPERRDPHAMDDVADEAE